MVNAACTALTRRNRMTVLVIGATGTIGSEIVRALAAQTPRSFVLPRAMSSERVRGSRASRRSNP